MQRLLRGMKGPFAGAVFVVGDRVSFGRASDSDIQILHPEVSRHHAKITRNEHDECVLVDLASDNGTTVNDLRIDRHVLRPGDSFCIHKSIFMFEEDLEGIAETSTVFESRVHSMECMRPTVLALPRIHASPGLHGVRPREFEPLVRRAWAEGSSPLGLVPDLEEEPSVTIVTDVEGRRWTPVRETVDPVHLDRVLPPPVVDVHPPDPDPGATWRDVDSEVSAPVELEAYDGYGEDISIEIVLEDDSRAHRWLPELVEPLPPGLKGVPWAVPGVPQPVAPEEDRLHPVEDAPTERHIASPTLDALPLDALPLDELPFEEPASVTADPPLAVAEVPGPALADLGPWHWIHDEDATLVGDGKIREPRPRETAPLPRRPSSGAHVVEADVPVQFIRERVSQEHVVEVGVAAVASTEGPVATRRSTRSRPIPRWQPSGVPDDASGPELHRSTWNATEDGHADDDGDVTRRYASLELPLVDEDADDAPDETRPMFKEDALIVLGDILEFRNLRERKHQLGGLPTTETLRLATLQARLHAWDHGRSIERAYYPSGWHPVSSLFWRNQGDLSSTPVTLRDLGPNQARIDVRPGAVSIGDDVWLVLDLTAVHATAQKLVFQARVTWWRPQEARMGLLFIGAAQYVDDPLRALQGPN